MLPPAPQFATTSMIRVLAGRAARARSGGAAGGGLYSMGGIGGTAGCMHEGFKNPSN